MSTTTLDPTASPRHTNDADAPLLPLRMLGEWVYCPRVFYLMHVAGLMEASAEVWRGRHRHSEVDRKTDRRARRAVAPSGEPGEAEDEAAQPSSWRRRTALALESEALGLTGKLDGVLLDPGGRSAVPTELKSGAGPQAKHLADPEAVEQGVWRADAVQVAAQAMLLEEAGYQVPALELYYAESRRLVRFQLTDALRAATREAIEGARRTERQPKAPPPLDDSPKCRGCSLVTVCMPEETLMLQRMRDEPDGEPRPVRRVLPQRVEESSLMVSSPGAVVRKHGDGLVVELVPEVAEREGLPVRQRVALDAVRELCVTERVQVTSGALIACAERGVEVSWLSWTGRVVAQAHGGLANNVALRVAQHRLAAEGGPGTARIVRGLLAGKLRNQRTLLRRNADGDAQVTAAVEELGALVRGLESSEAIEAMRGYEGRAARVYFEAFSRLLVARAGEGFAMAGRSRRPPRDPANVLLSFGYAVLTRDAASVVRRVGFDPMLGFLHVAGWGRPALALDLMEEFRPLVVDSTVLRVIAVGQLTAEDFVRETGGGMLLAEGARKGFARALRSRMDELVTHPTFGYRLSYLRALEVQARLLARVVEGELDVYRALTTR